MNKKDFDYGFLLDLELEKLSSMKDFFLSENTHIKDSKKIGAEINLAINLLLIAMEKNSAIHYDKNKKHNDKDCDDCYVLDTYVNVRNGNRFIHNFDSVKKTSIVKDCLRIQKAWFLYNKLRAYNMKTWWD